MRSCSVRSEIARAVAVIREIGRSARPATTHPAAIEASVSRGERDGEEHQDAAQAAVVGAGGGGAVGRQRVA